MQYNSASRCLKCDSCGREIDIEKMPAPEIDHDDNGDKDEPILEPFQSSSIEDEKDFKNFEKNAGFHTFGAVEGNQYTCKNCGAVVITTTDTTATHCSFCGAPVVLGDRLSGEMAPVKIIPFTIEKKQAVDAFRKWCKNGRLTPKGFMTADRIKNITGMYVPFWLYDLEGTGEADCTATRVRTYTRGNYIYTETKYYHVYRRVHLAYEKVPADASEKMNDELMDKLEPFSYSDLKTFKMPYLAGYLAEKYNFDDQQMLPRIMSRVKRYAEDYLRSTITGYATVHYNRSNIDLHQANAYYTMLPVWMVCYDYHDSEHIFAMNGQTGKIVGKPPLSKAKMAAWFISISAVVFALLRVITIFLL